MQHQHKEHYNSGRIQCRKFPLRKNFNSGNNLGGPLHFWNALRRSLQLGKISARCVQSYRDGSSSVWSNLTFCPLISLSSSRGHAFHLSHISRKYFTPKKSPPPHPLLVPAGVRSKCVIEASHPQDFYPPPPPPPPSSPAAIGNGFGHEVPLLLYVLYDVLLLEDERQTCIDFVDQRIGNVL